ncbi:methyl-accepting chemotaxis protein [Sulfuritortus calidifontis]|uniref:Methyl-accepting chemotaxis protein n=1 Tax=Sulfuritortus calidifontis TaxID=1914471 RepID=A0A4R3K0X6_9PROT|nr:methyl-accepting chemotaxis protein [Sulfuritortus calidifontis]TCS73806.1 methyl-accepting chemotaxis protein [Sulfuritortus calidifontis]
MPSTFLNNLFANQKIKTQLIVLLAVIFGFFVVSAAVSYRALNQAKADFTQFISQDQKIMLSLTELLANGLQMGQALRNIVLDPANPKAYENFDKASSQMDKLLKETREVAAADAELSAALAKIGELRQKQAAAQQAVKDKVAAQAIEEAKTVLNKEETPVWREIRQTLLDQAKLKKEAMVAKEVAVQGEVARAQTISLILTVIAIVLGLVLGMAVVGNIISRLNMLTQSIEGLAQGEGDLTTRLQVSGNNELCRISAAFNQFVENLQGMVNSIKANADQLHTMSTGLSDASVKIGTATAEQTAAVTSTAAAVEEMSATIASIADGTDHIKQVSSESADYSTQGLQKMGELTSVMNGVQQAVQGMAGSVHQFLESTQSIIGATQHVKDIADQINLLALNAAIEAARAGEQGRGFAVVADEVRKLAEKTALYANEISSVTSEMSSRSSQVESAIQQGMGALEESGRSSQQVSEVVSQAQQAVLKAAHGIGEISGSVKEQSLASSQIASNIERLSHLAENTEEAIAQSNATVQELRQVADTLYNTVSRFKS